MATPGNKQLLVLVKNCTSLLKALLEQRRLRILLTCKYFIKLCLTLPALTGVLLSCMEKKNCFVILIVIMRETSHPCPVHPVLEFFFNIPSISIWLERCQNWIKSLRNLFLSSFFHLLCVSPQPLPHSSTLGNYRTDSMVGIQRTISD